MQRFDSSHTLRLLLLVLGITGCGADTLTPTDAGGVESDAGNASPDAAQPPPADDGGTPPPIDAGPAGRVDAGDPPGELIFFDDFDYEVGREDASATETFVARGGWTWAKSIQSTGSHHGYVYTSDGVPGTVGPLPGGPGRVLVMEALPGSLGGQTDFYLQYGDEGGPDDAIPGNVWFQFWVTVANTDAQPSRIMHGKFIYPCNTAYPCHSQKWLFTMKNASAEPLWEELGAPTDGDHFYVNIANTELAEVSFAPAPEWDRWKLGQQDTSEHVTANRWTLVRVHFDTSTTSGVYEMWMRPFGGAWVKVAEWIDGVTEGFTWRIQPEHVGGHRVFRMPTTIGEAVPERTSYDAWIYMDDFAMATSADALPTYADEPLP